MKKTVAATALLGFFAMVGGAQAASSVTLYGIADAGLGHTRYKLNHGDASASHRHTGMRSGYLSSSRLGVKGKEDLGHGISAIFNFESKINLNDGASASNFWARQAWVGLSGGWGTFTMGRQKDMDSFVKGETVKSLGKYSRTFGGKGGRRDGLFKYVSPNFGGLQVGGAYAHREGKTRNFYGLGVNYGNGPIYAYGVYHRLKQDDGLAIKNWMVGGSYDFKVIKVVTAYGQDKDGKLNTPGDAKAKDFGAGKGLMESIGLGQYDRKGFKSKNYYLGAEAPVGPGTLGAMWSRSSSNMNRFGYRKKAQDIFGAMYVYKMSKRTNLYAYGAYGKGMGYVDNLKAREAGLGLRHKF